MTSNVTMLPSASVWPNKPLAFVQVTLPDGTSAIVKPERAYFDSHAVQVVDVSDKVKLLEDALKQIAAIQDQDFGHDFVEIDEARAIANAALANPT
jgi:hypothetical protein